MSVTYLSPQKGPQEVFMSTSADICIYGGAAGGGKTFALLLECLRHKNVKDFGAVIFRKNAIQISIEGGLWDASQKLYSRVKGAQPKLSPRYSWIFNGKSRVSFAHIERDDNLRQWQGSEIALIGFDELTHFTEKQFFYMLSRNRTTCGVKPYIRATCNPDADSWVASFISWWIDQETGYPIMERSGVIRYMARIDEVIIWGDTKEDVVRQGAKLKNIKTVTFICATLEDNKILMESDPGYMANLEALSLVERERLLHGNWKIKSAAGMYFKRVQIGKILTEMPTDIIAICRGWDLAATDQDENKDAAFTAGVLMAKRSNGRFVVLDVINQQLKAGEVRKLIMTTSAADKAKYGWVRQRLPQDPGQAGKEQAQSYIQMLAGYDVVVKLESGSKESRAEPMAAQWQNGYFDVMEGPWNEMYFNQLEAFPESKFKDMVDGSSSSFNELTLGLSFRVGSLL
ncbi:MAG: phage terminase large subunit [Lachnospiraceae bacterium]